jgi:hypothetical protein
MILYKSAAGKGRSTMGLVDAAAQGSSPRFARVRVAQTIDAVQKPHQSSDEAHLRGAKPLSNALALDMANWWAPTSENYFSRIKRHQILGAIAEATGKPAPERLNNLKKKDLAAEAQVADRREPLGAPNHPGLTTEAGSGSLIAPNSLAPERLKILTNRLEDEIRIA